MLAAKDPHGRLRPASTLKILTALTLLPELDPATVYTAQWEDANVEGSRAGLVPDATYTVDNLFQALFLVSGNDAASALANAAGGVPQTVAAMNATAKSLGALDTTVRNPSGLDAPGQYTSAYDLAVIARTAMARRGLPRLRRPRSRRSSPGKMPRAGKVRKTFEIYTQDRLLLNYRGAIGVKTGWTTKARGTFVGRGHPRRPDAGGHGAAQRGLRRLARLGGAAHLGLPQRRRGAAGRHPRRDRCPPRRASRPAGPGRPPSRRAAGVAADAGGLRRGGQTVPLVLLGVRRAAAAAGPAPSAGYAGAPAPRCRRCLSPARRAG